MADDDNIKRIPIKNLISEDGVYELLDSPETEPYVKMAVATTQGSDAPPELEGRSEMIRRLRSGASNAAMVKQ